MLSACFCLAVNKTCLSGIFKVEQEKREERDDQTCFIVSPSRSKMLNWMNEEESRFHSPDIGTQWGFGSTND